MASRGRRSPPPMLTYALHFLFCFRIFKEDLPSSWNLVGRSIANIVLGPITLARASTRVSGLGSKISKWALYLAPCTTFAMIIVCLALQMVFKGAWVFSVFFYLVYCCQVAIVRCFMRQDEGIPGSLLEDFILSLFFYPAVCTQMSAQDTKIVTVL